MNTDVVEGMFPAEVSGEGDEVGGEMFRSEDVVKGAAVEEVTKVEVSGVGEEVIELSVVREAEGVGGPALGALDEAEVVEEAR